MEQSLAAAIGPMISAFSQLAGLGDIRKQIQDKLEQLRKEVEKLIKSLLKKLIELLKPLAQALQQIFPGGNPQIAAAGAGGGMGGGDGHGGGGVPPGVPPEPNLDPCSGLKVIKFSLSGNAPNIAAHIKAAIPTKGRGPFTHDKSEANRAKRRRQACPGIRRGCPRQGDPPTHTSCDEYPFASSTAGGTGASTMCVPDAEQRSQGGTIRTTFLNDGEEYCVEVIP